MPTFKTFEEIDGWKEARLLRREVNLVTKRDPFRRDFALRDQICRASISIMANIAEGFERNRDREFIYFLRVAKSSAAEVRSHLFAALDESYISVEEFQALTERAKSVSRLIGKLIAYLIGNPKDPGPATRDPGPQNDEDQSYP